MPTIVVNQIVHAPIAEVWKSWDDFGNIYKFNPALSGSHLLTDKHAATDVGTRRECEMKDGKNFIREEVLAYEPMRKLKIGVYESSMPIKTMHASFELESLGQHKTNVTMTAEFEPGLGLLGKLILPMMKMQFRKMLSAMLLSNAKFVEAGTEVRQAA